MMFGPFDSLFDFDGDGKLNSYEEAVEMNYIFEHVYGDREDAEEEYDDDFDDDFDDEF